MSRTLPVLGPRVSVMWGGGFCVLGTVAIALLLPGFIRYHARQGSAHKAGEGPNVLGSPPTPAP